MFWILRTRTQKSRSPSPVIPRKPVAHEILRFKNHEIHVHRKAYRRSIGITLQVNGRIRVTAPKTTPLAEIERFLHHHTAWIETNLSRYRAVRDQHPRKRYAEGEVFSYLGRERRLRIRSEPRSRARFEVHDDELVAFVPESWLNDGDPRACMEQGLPQLAEPLANFFAEQGRAVLLERLRLYSERMNLHPSAVSIRSQKTRWGSCSSRGRISLNWRLIVAPLSVIDYVVVHELSHLRHYNHSASFWALVATQIPHYAEHREWLRANLYVADFLAKRSELYSD